MALEMILTSLDGVDPVVAKEYVQRDGKFVLDVKGAKSQLDVDALQKVVNKERETSKALQTQLEAWGNRKPEEVLPILDKVPELEAAVQAAGKKLDEKQLEAVVNGRLSPVQRALEKANTDLAAAQQQVAQYQQKETRRLIFDTVRKVAAESGAIKETYATDDGGFMLMADRLFTVDGQGRVVVREGITDLVHGQHPKDVVGELQRMHPYLWPPSSGGGASGGNGAGSQSSGNPFKANNMTARGEFIEANKNRPEVIKSAMQQAGLKTEYQRYVAPNS